MLGGILGKESYTLSQSYFVGGRPGGEYRVLPTFGDPEVGRCIDELDGDESGPGAELPRLGEKARKNGRASAAESEKIREGGRNRGLFEIGCRMRAAGSEEAEIDEALRAINAERCVPPLGEREVTAIARSAMRYEPNEEPTRTDSGNAARLIDLYRGLLRYVALWGLWLVCGRDGFWTSDHGDVLVRERAKEVGRELLREAAAEVSDDERKKKSRAASYALSSKGINAMVNLARGIEGVPLDHEALDRDPSLLGVENGVVDLRTGKLRAAQPEDLMTKRCPVHYDESAEAPRWKQAVGEWFDERDSRDYFQRNAGAVLIGEQRDHAFTIHIGGGANGKGAATRAFMRTLGPYAKVIHLSLIVATKHSQHDTVKADLFRVRLAVASETSGHAKLDEAQVKTLTGGDPISARRMRENPWSFIPSHSLHLQTNHLPQISGRDEGIWRRIRVVEWKRTFSEAEQDPHLDARLAEEAPGILRWLVEGCLAYQQQGLAEPEAVVRATLAYRGREDVLSRFAEDAGLMFRPDFEIGAGELQRALKEWCEAEGIERPVGVTAWLEERGARRVQKRTGNVRFKVWSGVGRESPLVGWEPKPEELEGF
jgi:putative DNA primase/helicase